MPKKPTFLIVGLADLDPEELHNIIADAVGEPRVHPDSRRMLRQDNRTSPETPRRNCNDVPSPRPPKR
jgi:hypothetical protein